MDFKNDIISLKDEVFGYSANNIKVEVYIDNINTTISPNQTNTVYLLDGVEVVNLQLTNTSPDHTVKLYPMIIGSRGRYIIDDDYAGFYIKNKSVDEKQRMNQFLYFRSKDAWTKEYLNTQSLFPFIKTDYQLCVNSDSKFDYLEIKPGESIIIPIQVESEEKIWATVEDADEQKAEVRGDENWQGEGFDYRDWFVYDGETIDVDGTTYYKFFRKPWNEGLNRNTGLLIDDLSRVKVDEEFDRGFSTYNENPDVEYKSYSLGKPITEVKKTGFTSSTMQFTLRTSLYTDPVSYEVEFTKTSDNMFSVIKKSQSTIKYNSIVK